MASHQQGFVYSFWKHRLAISMEPDTILDLRRQWPVGAHLVSKKWSAHNVMKRNGNIRLRIRSKSSMLCFEQQKEWLVDVFSGSVHPFLFCFETGLSPGAHRVSYNGWLARSKVLPPSPALGLQAHVTMPGFYVGIGDQTNSGHHPCMENVLPTEFSPSFIPTVILFCFKIIILLLPSLHSKFCKTWKAALRISSHSFTWTFPHPLHFWFSARGWEDQDK